VGSIEKEISAALCSSAVSARAAFRDIMKCQLHSLINHGKIRMNKIACLMRGIKWGGVLRC